MAKSSPADGAKKAPAMAKKSAPAKKTAAKRSAGAVKKTAAKKAPAAAGSAAANASHAAPAKKHAAKATKAPAANATKSGPSVALAGGRPATHVAKKSAVRPKSPFSAKFLEQQHEALLKERATYTRQAFNLQAEADSLVADFEPGDVQFDEESGEGDTLNIERERDLALSAQARAQIEEIDHALAKFDLGTYGICEVSGDPVPEERLEAIPWARQRVQYKTGGIGRR
jgi:RNA polymerase-binding transcription factor DksA